MIKPDCGVAAAGTVENFAQSFKKMKIKNFLRVNKCLCFKLKSCCLFVAYLELVLGLIIIALGHKNWLSIHFAFAGEN